MALSEMAKEQHVVSDIQVMQQHLFFTASGAG